MKRQIIEIDEDKCNGCGLCIPNCPEGALQIIDNKVRLVSDLFCDGLGACIGHCPEGAITTIEREAEPYDERRVMENIVKAGDNTIKAHLEHMKEHNETEYLKQAVDYLKEKGIDNPLDEADSGNAASHGFEGCPGSKVMDLKRDGPESDIPDVKLQSELGQWPIQFHLVPVNAPYFKDADILVAADCVPFAYANFHRDFLKGKALLIGCPKLDDAKFYTEKLTEILKNNDIKSITLVNMEVPCCFGLQHVVEEAIKASGKVVPLRQTVITVDGKKQ